MDVFDFLDLEDIRRRRRDLGKDSDVRRMLDGNGVGDRVTDREECFIDLGFDANVVCICRKARDAKSCDKQKRKEK